MVIMVVSKEKQLFRVVEEHMSDRVKAELLSFWSRHPSDEFTVNVVSCTLGFSKLEVNKALKHLIEAGFVETHTRDGVVLYHLTADEKRRITVLELSARGYDICREYIGKNLR